MDCVYRVWSPHILLGYRWYELYMPYAGHLTVRWLVAADFFYRFQDKFPSRFKLYRKKKLILEPTNVVSFRRSVQIPTWNG